MMDRAQNPFLEKPLLALYLRTALPIILPADDTRLRHRFG